MTLEQLRQALGKAVDELNAPEVIADAAAFEAKELEITNLKAQIERVQRAQAASAAVARPVTEPAAVTVPAQASGETKGFKTLGEQLIAIRNHYDPLIRQTDTRLVRAPSGASEGDPSSGGFFVQTDIATEIMSRSYELGQILSKARKISISTNANGIKIPGVDESSRVNGSRWGGVSTQWLGEAVAGTPSRPKFRMIELDLKKLMSLWYVTDEMLQDQSVLTAVANQAFTEEFMFTVEDAMVRGSGNGMPLGILNSPAKVTVAKETGQAAGTVQFENIQKMWSRMWGKSRANAVWFINQDVEPQLNAMSIVVGTGGAPAYLPANGISGSPFGTLMGRPVVPVEYCESVGTEGDIILADYSQYILADKGGAQTASSMHVAFLTDEQVYRITYRVDGEPTWHKALTPFKGSNTLSPFVTLATR